MNNKKVAKKKKREKEVKEKLLRRRSKIREEAREVRDKEKKERDAMRNVNRHTMTINNKEIPKKSEEEIRSQLEKNMAILQALEQEYQGTMKSREEYVKHLQEKQAESQSNFAGSFEVEFNPFHTEQDRIDYEERKKREEEENIKRAQEQNN